MAHSELYDDFLKREEAKNLGLKKELPQGTKLVEIGMMVQLYRKKHGYTQSQLAKRVHMPQSTIARIENGDNVNIKSLYKIAKVIGFSNYLTSSDK